MLVTPQAQTKAVSIVLVMFCIAGCVSSDQKMARMQDVAWKEAPQTTVPDTREPEPPKILPETHFAAGRLYESQGLYDKAIMQYRKAAAGNHAYVDAYHRVALLLSMTGQHRQASVAFEKAVQLRPDDPVLRNNLGFELLLLERWADAANEFQRAVQLRPVFARAHINLGIAKSRMGLHQAALASFRNVLPEADAYYNLGLMHRIQGQHRQAAECFRHVLRVHADFAAAKTQLAEIQPFLKTQTPLAAAVENVDSSPATNGFERSADVGPCSPAVYEFATWSPADLFSHAAAPMPTTVDENLMCLQTEPIFDHDIFTLNREAIASETFDSTTDMWDSVSDGSFALSFRENQFDLIDFLAILDNEYRCHEEWDAIPSTTTTFVQGSVPEMLRRPTLAATVVKRDVPARPPADLAKVAHLAKNSELRRFAKMTMELRTFAKKQRTWTPSARKSKKPTAVKKVAPERKAKKVSEPHAAKQPKAKPVTRPVATAKRTTTKVVRTKTNEPHPCLAVLPKDHVVNIKHVPAPPTPTFRSAVGMHQFDDDARLSTVAAAGAMVFDSTTDDHTLVGPVRHPRRGFARAVTARPTLAYTVRTGQPTTTASRPTSSPFAGVSPRVQKHLANLADLKDRLDIVRNEIDCLDSVVAPPNPEH